MIHLIKRKRLQEVNLQTKQLGSFPFQFPFFLFFYFLLTEVATCSPRLPIFVSAAFACRHNDKL